MFMNKFLVFQSDFGLVDGAVSAMEGVALQVDPGIKIHHLRKLSIISNSKLLA